MKQNGICHIVIDMQGTKKVDIPEHIMHSIMEIVLKKEHHPILIHCNHGKVFLPFFSHRIKINMESIEPVVQWQS